MHYFLSKMVRIKIEDIIFWIIIFLIILVALWLLSGSPTEIGAIISIATFTASSGLLIWKKIFSINNNFNLKLSNMDKNVTVSFMKLKHDMEIEFLKINNKLDIINKK